MTTLCVCNTKTSTKYKKKIIVIDNFVFDVLNVLKNLMGYCNIGPNFDLLWEIFNVIREIFIMPNGQIYEKLRYCQLVTTDLVIVVVTVNVVVVVVVVVGVVVVINIVVNVVRVYPEKVIKCFKLCRNCQERKIARGRG